jgi:hypothetical protein
MFRTGLFFLLVGLLATAARLDPIGLVTIRIGAFVLALEFFSLMFPVIFGFFDRRRSIV